MLLYKKLKVPVIPSTHFIKTTCFYQMKNIVDGLTDKSEDRIERDHQIVNLMKNIVVGLEIFNNLKFYN